MEAFLEVLRRCKVCRIGTADPEGMMIVPMNFGYEETGGGVCLYFHSRGHGRKIQALRSEPKVCFELDAQGGLVIRGDGQRACEYGYTIHSAMGRGEITFVEEPEEKRRALERITLHQTGRELPIPPEAAEKVSVLKLTVTQVTTRRKHC